MRTWIIDARTVPAIAMVSVLCGCANAPSAPATRGSVGSEIEAFARKALDQVGTAPGLTVAVVDAKGVVYRGDFGLRDVAAKLPVTADTRFYLASSTKAFTAMAAAILAGEGKLDLDAPVSAVWPDLTLTPPITPKDFSLRDLLAMRSGLRNDTANFRAEIGNLPDERELLRLFAIYSRQEQKTFRYDNMSYVLAGMVMKKVTGDAWSDLVRERIVGPLGMSATVVGLPDPALPITKCYQLRGPGDFLETPVEFDEIAGPAAAMESTSSDLAKWLVAMINEGRLGGRQVLPAAAVRLVQTEQTKNDRRFRYIDRFAWGLGQDLGKYEGGLIVHRFGGLNGAYSHVSFMPERRIGVVALSNGGGAVPDAVAAYAYDLLLGRGDVDAKWAAELGRVADAVAKDLQQRQGSAAQVAESRRPLRRPAVTYVGSYHYDRLGDINVTQTGGRLEAKLGRYRAELISTGDDAFLVDWISSGESTPIRFVFETGDRPSRIDWGGRLFERVR